MTKQPQNIVGSDVPLDGGTGAPEIIITQEMWEAGFSVLELWEGRLPSEDLAEKVYIAMVDQRRTRR